MALVCSHCGVTTAPTPVELRFEPEYEEGYYTKPAVFEGADYSPELAVIACQNCGRLFLTQKVRYSDQKALRTEWKTVWPAPTRPVSQDVPHAVRTAFEDAVLCLGAGALGGCLMMCRTVLVRLQRDQQVGNLKELKEKGKISQMLCEQADEVRLWANVIGHEDFDATLLSQPVCEELVTYVELLLEAVYVQPARLARQRELRQQAKGRRANPD